MAKSQRGAKSLSDPYATSCEGRASVRSHRRSGKECTMEQRATRLLADTAGLGADTTMLMHAHMALAFRSADATNLGAGHQLRFDQHRAGLRQA